MRNKSFSKCDDKQENTSWRQKERGSNDGSDQGAIRKKRLWTFKTLQPCLELPSASVFIWRPSWKRILFPPVATKSNCFVSCDSWGFLVCFYFYCCWIHKRTSLPKNTSIKIVTVIHSFSIFVVTVINQSKDWRWLPLRSFPLMLV